MSLTSAPDGLQLPSARLATERLMTSVRSANPLLVTALGDAMYTFGKWQEDCRGELSKTQREALLGRVRDLLEDVLA